MGYTYGWRVGVWVWVCVGVGVWGFHHFYQVSQLSLYGHTGVLGSGRTPLVRPTVPARGASLCCPSISAICTLGENLACCPRRTLEVGWWLRGFCQASSKEDPGSGVVAPWLLPG